MRQGRRITARKAHAGFTLFEMVVTICSIVILYMVAEQRLNELPAAAERASFLGVLEQIKTGVNFAMITKLAGGHGNEISAMANANPMDFLLEAPSNYRGELALVTDAVKFRNSWYFETSTSELVYVVGGASIGNVFVTIGNVPVNLGQIRLRVSHVYADDVTSVTGAQPDTANNGGNANNRNWQGVLLSPVYAWRWDRSEEQPVELN